MTFKNPSPVFGFLKLGLFVSLLLMKAKTKQKKKSFTLLTKRKYDLLRDTVPYINTLNNFYSPYTFITIFIYKYCT